MSHITWTHNANRTLSETTIDGISCVVFQGTPNANGHTWYYRAGTEFTFEAMSRVEAFKGCVTAAKFIADFAPSWAAAA